MIDRNEIPADLFIRIVTTLCKIAYSSASEDDNDESGNVDEDKYFMTVPSIVRLFPTMPLPGTEDRDSC